MPGKCHKKRILFCSFLYGLSWATVSVLVSLSFVDESVVNQWVRTRNEKKGKKGWANDQQHTKRASNIILWQGEWQQTQLYSWITDKGQTCTREDIAKYLGFPTVYRCGINERMDCCSKLTHSISYIFIVPGWMFSVGWSKGEALEYKNAESAIIDMRTTVSHCWRNSPSSNVFGRILDGWRTDGRTVLCSSMLFFHDLQSGSCLPVWLSLRQSPCLSLRLNVSAEHKDI